MRWFSRIRHWFHDSAREDDVDTDDAAPRSAEALMAERRLSFVLRSSAHLLFAVGFFWPTLDYPMLIRLFAAYLFVDGILALAPGGLRLCSRRVWPLLAGGAVNIAVAVAAYGWPGLSFSMLVGLAAIWAVGFGIAWAAAWFSLRPADRDHLLLLGSIAALLFGRALLSYKAGDVVVLSTWIGLYAVAMGVITLNLSMRQYRLSW